MADDAGNPPSLYDVDTVAWAEHQAAALRQREASRGQLDYENLAEEIEDGARSVERACRSAIDQIIEHLLKLEYATAATLARDRRGWQVSILKQHHELADEITSTLRQRLPRTLSERFERQVQYCERAGVIDRAAATQARARGS